MHQHHQYNISRWPLTPSHSSQPSPMIYWPPQPHAQHHCPPVYDPTNPTMVYIPHMSQKAHLYLPSPAQPFNLPSPSPTCHPISLIHQAWTEIHQEGGMRWLKAAYHGYPKAASAWASTVSSPKHCAGSRLTGPVTSSEGFLGGIIWKIHARSLEK